MKSINLIPNFGQQEYDQHPFLYSWREIRIAGYLVSQLWLASCI